MDELKGAISNGSCPACIKRFLVLIYKLLSHNLVLKVGKIQTSTKRLLKHSISSFISVNDVGVAYNIFK
jgi:hypothetical protein